METLLQFFGLTENNIIQCNIYIDDDPIPNGYGLVLNNYVLTLHHIITGKKICIDKIIYNILYEFEEYDIIVLCKNNYKGNITEFLTLLENEINTNCIKLSDINKYMNTRFKIFKSNIILNLNRIENTSLKSNILPQILLGKFNMILNTDISDLDDLADLAGFSGSICYKNNLIFGLLISQNNEDIEIIPLEIIFDLLNIHYKYGIRYLPINMNGNNITDRYKNFYKNDIILQMNNIDVDDFGMIYYQKYNQHIPISSYILLYEYNKIYFKIHRNILKTKKIINITYNIEKFTENKIQINIKENPKEISIKNLCFKELSE